VTGSALLRERPPS